MHGFVQFAKQGCELMSLSRLLIHQKWKALSCPGDHPSNHLEKKDAHDTR